DNMYGRGISWEEAQQMKSKWNEEASMEKFIFASQKVRGGYISSERKQKHLRRKLQLMREREGRKKGGGWDDEDEFGAGPNPMDDFGEGLDLSKAVAKVKKDKMEYADDSSSSSSSSSGDDVEDMTPTAVPDDASSSSDYDPNEYEKMKRTKKAPKPHTSPPRKLDPKVRLQRRAKRRENAAFRSHRIMEMDPARLKNIRAEIQSKREEDRERRKANNTAKVNSIIKHNRAVLSAVNETITADANTAPQGPELSGTSWTKMQLPPPPMAYDGAEEGEVKDYDTNQSLEWRSDSRIKDIQKAHNELHRVTHAATLKDLLETISDLREDIEKTKKDKRKLVKNLARVDKLKKGRERQEGTLGDLFAVKEKLETAKRNVEGQIREMEEMLENLQESRKSLVTGASAEIQTNDDGCPLYYKLLLDIRQPKDVTAEQKDTYEFLKQTSVREQMEFMNFALEPDHAKDLLPTASAFLKLHAHSHKSLKRFKRNATFADPHMVQLLCCAAESYHVEHLSPVMALCWLFAKVPANRSIMLRLGVVGICIKRLKSYADVVKRKKRKGVGSRMIVNEQSLVALTMLSTMIFE
ncbi:hypothetical protein TrRE_jg3560, partial [Triparma retinervis]